MWTCLPQEGCEKSQHTPACSPGIHPRNQRELKQLNVSKIVKVSINQSSQELLKRNDLNAWLLPQTPDMGNPWLLSTSAWRLGCLQASHTSPSRQNSLPAPIPSPKSLSLLSSSSGYTTHPFPNRLQSPESSLIHPFPSPHPYQLICKSCWLSLQDIPLIRPLLTNPLGHLREPSLHWSPIFSLTTQQPEGSFNLTNLAMLALCLKSISLRTK